ncbi:MAG: hypothetical protein JRD68_03930 [Deltaproteobacteria bacterium]|nr:hypothetical protein [Deltaproteobacteria bacterium]
MKYKKYLSAFLILMFVSFLPSANSAQTNGLASIEQLKQWASTLIDFGAGNPVFPYVRQAGTEADNRASQWFVEMFTSFGLKDVRREPVPLIGWKPSEWGLKAHSNDGEIILDSWPIFYARFLDKGSITAPMVYVGSSPDDFPSDVSGKIVVADMLCPEIISFDGAKRTAFETYDPDGTIKAGEKHRYWTFTNQKLYQLAANSGAAAFIGINRDKADNGRYYQNYGHVRPNPRNEEGDELGQLPGLYVSRMTGKVLRPLAQKGLTATVISAGSNPMTQTYNIVGYLPGKSEKIIRVQSHSDGGAVNDASGATAVLALAEYYSKLKSNKRTFQFVITGGHFTMGRGSTAFIKEHTFEIYSKDVVNFTIEHVGKHYDIVDGKLVDSGLPCPTFLFSTNKEWFPLLSEAVYKYDLKRTFIHPYSSPSHGEGASWHWRTRQPSIFAIAPVQYMQSSADTSEKIPFDRLRAITSVFMHLINKLDNTLDQ